MSVRVNIDDRIVPPEEAVVSVFDRSFLFGDSVYETMRTYDGQLALVDEHFSRLWTSAEALRLTMPLTAEELRGRCEATIAAAGNAESYVRVIVTRGEGDFGLQQGLGAAGRVVIIVRPYAALPADMYENGVDVIVAQTRRTSPQALNPAIKSGNYLNNILAALEAKDAGVYDAILLNGEGFVTEGTTSNVFAVRDGVLLTPPLSAGILDGVTRRFTLHAARRAEIPVQERNLTAAELRGADEVFLTSTLKEILPVRQVDDREIVDGRPGPLTRRLRRLLHAEIRRRI